MKHDKKKSQDPLALALKKMSYRACTQRQLEMYLTKAQFTQEQITEVIRKMQDWGYLNDQKLAVYWYESLLKKPYGYAYIYKKLQEKGIPQQIINSVLEDYDEKKELELAHSLAQKLIAGKFNGEPLAKKQEKEKIARHLHRKGFSHTNIMNIINELFPETP